VGSTVQIDGDGVVDSLDGTDSPGIQNSYASGAVSGSDSVAGLIGYLGNGAEVEDSYATGRVSGSTRVGGLVGSREASETATDSFWNRGTTDQTSSIVGTSKSTSDMQTLATYTSASWAIIAATAFEEPDGTAQEVWGIGADVNCGYPFLWWQKVSGHTCPAPTSAGGSDTAGTVSPAIHLDLKAKTGDVVAGSSVLMEGQGLAPGSEYSLVVRSTPVTVKSGVVTRGGTFSHTVTLPEGIAPGVHTITLTATGSDGGSLTLTQSFTVASNGTFSALGSVTGQVTGGLAATGVDGPLALGATSLAALLVLVGAGLLVARRRAEALSS
jgi:hypothetical protein